MTADNPTVDDLRLVASNMKSEGHTSRAVLIENAANEMERLEALLTEAEQALDKLSRANNGILWLSNNIHNYGGNDFLNFMRSAIEDSKAASAATVATLAKLKDR
jgi:hypothetical protein